MNKLTSRFVCKKGNKRPSVLIMQAYFVRMEIQKKEVGLAYV
jgi:hypothetical protein